MSWQVHCIENTTTVRNPEAKVFRRAAREAGLDVDDIVEDDGLVFNEDYGEHIDWIDRDSKVLERLWSNAGVRGRILFGSLEGDNAGEFWGYEFTDDGWSFLKGRLKWKVRELK